MAHPRDNTNLVQATAGAHPLPANRPIDHARRIGTATAFGLALGTVGGVLFLDVNFAGASFFITLAVSLVLIAACVSPWLINPRSSSTPIPVVARTLGTKEHPAARYVHRGTNRSGLLVPVIVRPVDGSANFRSVILIKDVDERNPHDPPIGTLLALDQISPEMGELISSPHITEEQAALMERLRKHPRELSNNAAPLPLRRSPTDRTPWWAGVQWWVSIVVGMGLGLLVVHLMAG